MLANPSEFTPYHICVPFESSDHGTPLTTMIASCPHPTDLPIKTNTIIAGCTYVAKSDWGCITTAKQTHCLKNVRITDYVSKWTDDACVNLLKLGVFASSTLFWPPKLLPVTEKSPTETTPLWGPRPTQHPPQNSSKSTQILWGTSFPYCQPRQQWVHFSKDNISLTPTSWIWKPRGLCQHR